MKRLTIVLFLLSLLFISACVKETVIKESSFCKDPYFEYKEGECCLDKSNNSICDKDEIKVQETLVLEELEVEEIIVEEPEVEEEIQEPVLETEKLEEGNYQLSIGDTIKFNNVEIKLISLDVGENLNAVFDVGGKLTTIYGTKTQDIVGDVSLFIDTIIGVGDDVSISIKVEEFGLETNSYLVKTEDVLNIGGKQIIIRSILKEKENVILLDIDEDLKQRLLEGKTKTFDNIEITNVKIFFKGTKIDNYAILEINVK
ncbi:MAG: hypothetical protein QGF74_02630 [Candidatus Nanoarchaeia archaeon]|jgi:hypothetical protein|nr:hypothetical protein [Candidatus Nanoarchaeia archaeon]|tara:strand:+ start:24463 stop:25236 length:774 start_codon:yes stop_codon:yes gene_type:complete